MKLSMKDLVPADSTFTLKAFPGEEFRLRKINGHDEIWLQQTWGNDFANVFSEARLKDLCRIAFHQLNEDQKHHFKKQTVKVVNEEGDEAEHQIGGYLLMACSVVGMEEKTRICEAILETIGISRPMQKEITDGVDQKKSEQQMSTGDISSTSSAINTVGL